VCAFNLINLKKKVQKGLAFYEENKKRYKWKKKKNSGKQDKRIKEKHDKIILFKKKKYLDENKIYY